MSAHASGLALYRARQAEEKRLRMEELDFYRLFATTVERDGQEFTLVRIPDLYDLPRVEVAQRVEPRRQKRSGRMTGRR